MPIAYADGILTEYAIRGEGPPLLMFSPGGFDARMEKWSDLGVYGRTRLLEHLSKNFQCIMFDRRENGRSGGRVEAVTWSHFARQGIGLLDELGIDSAHILGGCMGCAPVAAFATEFPTRARSLTFFWPVGGARYRINSHQRFVRHIVFVENQGLQGVVDLALSHEKNFSADPRCGPWVQCIRNSQSFAETYTNLDPQAYILTVTQLYRCLFDRDTAPGAEPEALLNIRKPCLVVPGADQTHSTAAAHYLHECIAESEIWNVHADDQLEENTSARVLDFLGAAERDWRF